jgi:hypothetical protein
VALISATNLRDTVPHSAVTRSIVFRHALPVQQSITRPGHSIASHHSFVFHLDESAVQAGQATPCHCIARNYSGPQHHMTLQAPCLPLHRPRRHQRVAWRTRKTHGSTVRLQPGTEQSAYSDASAEQLGGIFQDSDTIFASQPLNSLYAAANWSMTRVQRLQAPSHSNRN